MTVITEKRSYTFEEYIAYDDKIDRRYELVNGELIIMTPPTF